MCALRVNFGRLVASRRIYSLQRRSVFFPKNPLHHLKQKPISYLSTVGQKRLFATEKSDSDKEVENFFGKKDDSQIAKEELELQKEMDDFQKNVEMGSDTIKEFRPSSAKDPILEKMVKEDKERLEKESPPPEKEQLIEETEVVKGQADQMEFQAETQKLLDIVARSLYTEREVFVRELVSNASDALEKLRHRQMLGHTIIDNDLPLEIRISVDENKKTFTIQDTGIGMTREELIKNLGRIGHSGTSEFLKLVEQKDSTSLIGQFGVGFYSTFMVGHTVKVYSKSAVDPNARGWAWKSDGSGVYTICEAEGVSRGTKVIVELRDNAYEFSRRSEIERIIKKYSNFVGFPIYVNGTRVNTVKALWTLPKDKITDEEHKEFYQFIANAYDEPMYKFQYMTDSPLSIRALFYVPEQHMEKYGLSRMEPGVSLFSRKVLIQQKCKGLLPEWLRFIKGVVDSEDVPLNLSREHLQDSSLLQRLSNVLTKKLLKSFDEEATKDPQKYEKFFKEFGHFLKEGVCTDSKFKEEIAKLLRMESSKMKEGEFTTLDKYIENMRQGQKDIFFLVIPNRAFAESSPYFEAFKERDVEVLFLYTAIDDFVMSNLAEYKGKKVLSIESADAAAALQEISKLQDEKEEPKDRQNEELIPLKGERFKDFAMWFKDILSGRVTTVTETTRLSNSPAVIVDHESAAFRRAMRFVDPQRAPQLPKQQIQINPKHPIIIKLDSLRHAEPELAKEIAEQILDNALIQAGLLDDGRSMIPRLQKILDTTLSSRLPKSQQTQAQSQTQSQAQQPQEQTQQQ